jgi:3-phosphoshikimate 1-carboxyvinyltransferase
MMAICAALPGEHRLTAGPSLAQRPVNTLVDALRQLGVSCSSNGDLPPVTVDGGTLKGGTAALRGDVSSQFVSALLFAAPLAKEKITIYLTTPLESQPYVMMTLECLVKFGIGVEVSPDFRQFEVSPQAYQPTRYTVEGDWSSASYLLALGAVAGEVIVQNLNPQSLQGDKVILDYLQRMGASVLVGQNDITVKRGRLRAINANLNDSIDLLPTMAVLAAVAEGTSEFTGIRRARLKESDRITAIREGLERLGIPVTETDDTLTVTGAVPKSAVIDSRADHRIAMAFSIIGIHAGNVVIDGAECVGKTFPEYWSILESIGGEVKNHE